MGVFYLNFKTNIFNKGNTELYTDILHKICNREFPINKVLKLYSKA